MISYIHGFASVSPSTSATNYNSIFNSGAGSWNATESLRSGFVSFATTLDQLRITVTTAPGASKSYAYTVMKNGVATALTVTISGTATSAQDTSHSVNFVAGDNISLQAVPSGTPTAPGISQWNIRMAGTGFPVMGQDVASATTAATRYMALQGRSTASSTEALMSAPIPVAGTISQLRLWKSTAGAAGTSHALTLMVNGAASTLTASAAAVTTASDLSHSVSVNAGDMVSMRIVTTGTPVAANIAFGVLFTPTTDADSFLLYTDITAQPSTSATNYQQPLSDGVGAWTATETSAVLRVGALTVKSYYVSTSVSPGTSPKQYTFKVRKEIADTAASVVITDASSVSGSTRFGSITGQAVQFANDDRLAVSATPSGTPLGLFAKMGIGITTAPIIDQAAFRLYEDGTETGSTAIAAQSTNITRDVTTNSNLQLRLRAQETNGVSGNSTDDFQLQYSKNGGNYQNIGLYGNISQTDHSSTTLVNGLSGNSNQSAGQTFLTASAFTLVGVGLWVFTGGSPTDGLQVELRATDPNGTLIATSDTVDASSLSSTGKEIIFNFSTPQSLSGSTTYSIVLVRTGTGSAVNYYKVGESSSSLYAGGSGYDHNGAGGSWSATTLDLYFAIYGDNAVVTGYNSASLTDGGATTNRLTGGSGSFVAGLISEDGLADNLAITAANYTELLYSLTLVSANVADTDTIDFKVTNNNTLASATYTVTPRITVSKTTGPTTIAITKALQYSVKLTPTASTKSLKYTIKSSVAATTKSLKYTVKKAASAVTKSLKYTVLKTISTVTKSLKYTTKVTPAALTKSLQYMIKKASLSITKSLIYDIKKPISVTKSLQYTTKRSISTLTKSLQYTIKRTQTAITRSLQYTVKKAQSVTKSLQYAIKSTKTGLTKSLTYSIRRTASALTKSLQYNVITATTTNITRSLKYTVKTSISSLTKSLQYNVKVPIAITKSLKYTIKLTSISITKSLLYEVKIVHSITKSLQYAVKKAGLSITKSLRYDIKLPTIDIQKSLQYTIRTTNQITKSLIYDVKKNIQITKTLIYDVKHSGVTFSKSLMYAIKRPVSLTKSLVYDVKHALSITKSLKYTVTASVTSLTKSLKYTVKTAQSITKSLIYDIRHAVSSTKQLKYAIRVTPSAVTKALKYTVKLPVTITKSLVYRLLATLYYRESKTSLPTTAAPLATLYSSSDLVAAATVDSSYVDLVGTKTYQVHEFAVYNASTQSVTLTWTGKSSVAPSTSTIYLQIYNFTTSSWETLDSNSSAAANTNVTLTGNKVTGLANYYDGASYVWGRVYQ